MSDAAEQLFIAHYEQLRRMARRELRYGVRATLGPTTLLHETFLDISRRASLRFADGGQFMAYAARAMRGLVICHLRNRYAQKRGGGLPVTCLPMETPQAVQGPTHTIEIEKLSHALESLARLDPRLAECVDLKFFCGYSFKEIAQTRSVSERTVRREWNKARLLLHRLISDCYTDEPATTQAGSWDGVARRRIGGYTLERLIDRGGTSEVWLATHDGRFGARCAIKLAAGSAGEPTFRDVLRREAELLAGLEHPNIARLLDQGATDDGRQFLVLEYVEGERIDQYCRSRQLPVAVRLRLFLDVLAAVGHVHDRLMIHRDLKPANVLVTRDGTVKLVDFGIAKLLCEQQHDVASSGAVSATALTPEYAAPEQLHGGALSPATDVYQLGMLLQALLSNADASRQLSGSPAKRMEAALIRSARRISQLAQAPLREILRDGVEAALARALDADPARRYPTAAAFRGEIARLLTDR